MKISTKLLATTLLAVTAAGASAQNTPTSQMEQLDRGLVVVRSGSDNFVSWRLLGTDDDFTTFNLLCDGTRIRANMHDATCYTHANGPAIGKYQVVTLHHGEPVDTSDVVTPWSDIYYRLQLDRPAGGKTPANESYTYTPNDCSVGDVDGDGQYEIIVKWDPSNSKDNSQSGYTGNVYLDCYELDGTKLWRIDLGVNIRAGAHYTQFLVWDFDGDGKAEMICKTGPGSRDASGKFVNQVATDDEIKSANNNQDWRNSSGKLKGGQEYLTVFNGLTGEAIHTVFYNPNRAMGYGGAPSWTKNWDDRAGKTDTEYGNRGERYLATVAYLDGPDSTPSAVMCRGYYTYAFLWAVDFDGKELTTKWFHSAMSKTQYSVTDAEGNTQTYTAAAPTGRSSGSRTAYGNGNHNLSCADVDGDGCDEVIWGACGIDHDGKLLYATGYGHGDAMHLSDLCPDRPGLELFTVHEESPYGWNVHDAATGEIIQSATGSGDNGRGLSADVDTRYRGFEFWSSNDRQPRSAVNGNALDEKGSTSVNFRVYWDGDLADELYDDKKIEKWNTDNGGATRLLTMYDYGNSSDCNSTKHTPNLQADILGDWREEIILFDGVNGDALNIFTTTKETEYRLPTLMHDHTYRLGVAWQNTAYNQPPHLGYYLPDAFQTRYAMISGSFEQTVNVGDSIETIKFKWVNCGRPAIVRSIMPDGTERNAVAPTGFKYTRNTLTDRTFVLEGAPQEPGDYMIVLVSGANVIDNSTRNDTIIIHSIASTGINSVGATGEGKAWVKLSNGAFADVIGLDLDLAAARNVNVALYNTAGAQVFSQTYAVNGSEHVSVSGLGNLSNGVYIIRVTSAEGTFGAKLIKR